MKTNNMRLWKKATLYITCFIVCFFTSVALDLACGPEPDPYDYYVSFFHNNLGKNSGYQPFYFNGALFLNDDNEPLNEHDVNIKEWVVYLHNKVKPLDVKRVLYDLDKKTDSLYFWHYNAPSPHFPDSLKRNSFIRELNKNKAAFNYLATVKKAESMAGEDYDGTWNLKPRNKNWMYNAAMQYQKKGINTSDRFLKLRNFYQAQRMLQYGGHPKQASDLYDHYIKNIHSSSHVIGWALSLKAGAQFALYHDATSALLFARVFAHYPERRIQAYHDFKAVKTPVAQIIKQAKTNEEKANVYAINGFHNPHVNLNALANVYRVSPKSALVTVLLLREINKVEEGYLTPKLNGDKYYGSIGLYRSEQYDSVRRNYRHYIPQLKTFCMRLATEGRCAEPALGYIASAYLEWIQGDAATGLKIIDSIPHQHIRAKLYDQQQLVKLLLLSKQIKTLNAETEHQLLPSLIWLAKKVRREKLIKPDSAKFFGDYDLKYYSASSRDFYAKVLAPIYNKQKDTAMAALCILKSENTVAAKYPRGQSLGLGFGMPSFWQNYLHSYHLNKILGWYQSPSKPPYLSMMLSAVNHKTLAGIYDVQGTAYLREHNYSKAVLSFKRIDISKLNKAASLYNDSLPNYIEPFTDRLHDYTISYKRKPTLGYNKLSFAKEMLRLQTKAKTDKKQAANCYYAMANGLYNVSYYGNAWYYSAFEWTSADKSRTAGLYYDADYLSTGSAEQLYLKARQLSNDLEFKARCTFMAAKCCQKRQRRPAYPDFTDNNNTYDKRQKLYERRVDAYDAGIRQNIYYADLKQHYSKTRFYKTAVSDCSYLRDFITGKH